MSFFTRLFREALLVHMQRGDQPALQRALMRAHRFSPAEAAVTARQLCVLPPGEALAHLDEIVAGT